MDINLVFYVYLKHKRESLIFSYLTLTAVPNVTNVTKATYVRNKLECSFAAVLPSLV